MDPAPTFAELMWNPGVYWFWACVVFGFGLLWGSFFNVAIYRIPLGMSVNRPRRSFCYRCGSTLTAIENIPVLSWLIQRGRCRHCDSKISPRYAFVELFTAVLFLVVFLAANPVHSDKFAFATIWYLAFAGLLIIGTFTDFDHWIIPDEVTIGGTIAGLVAAVAIGLLDGRCVLTDAGPFPSLRGAMGGPWFGYIEVLIAGSAPWLPKIAPYWWEAPANALLGAIFGPGLLYGIGLFGKLLFRKDAMGFGDVKLFGLIGATLGPTNCLVVLMLSAIFGSVAGGAAFLLSFFAKDRPGLLAKGRDFPAPEVPEGEEARPLDKFLAAMEHAPSQRRPHHLPYGPWIALAAILVLVFSAQVRMGIAGLLAP